VKYDMCQSQWGDFIPEGVVARPRVELRTRRGARVIVKLKQKDSRRRMETQQTNGEIRTVVSSQDPMIRR